MEQQQQLEVSIAPTSSQRERNRVAVRKCREKKRELEHVLQLRANELEVENARLRTKLELESIEAKGAKELHNETKVSTMADLLKQYNFHLYGKNQGFESKIEQAVDEYDQRHHDYGRDKASALKYLVNRLHHEAKSDAVTKSYLSLIGRSFDEAFYSSSLPDSPWQEFVNVVQLRPEQEALLKRRRLQGARVIAEVEYAEKRIDKLHQHLRNLKSYGLAFKKVRDVLTPRQTAKFMVWTFTDPACSDLLDRLYNEMSQGFDVDILQQRDFERENDEMRKEVERLLYEARLSSGAMVKKIFETVNENELETLIRRHFHENVILIDPNNGGEHHGREAVCQYVRRIQKAFGVGEEVARNFAVFDKSISVEGATVRGSFEIVGTYSGKLALLSSSSSSSSITEHDRKRQKLDSINPDTTNIMETEVGSLKRKVSSSEQQSGSKLVACDVMVLLTFAEDSDRITEAVVGMDTMSLMSQLGLVDVPGRTRGLLSSTTNTSVVRRLSAQDSLQKSSDSKGIVIAEEDVNALMTNENLVADARAIRARYHARLKDLFEADDVAQRELIAQSILHPNCVFTDSNLAEKSINMEGCVAYVNRIRRAFSKMRILKSTISDGVSSSSTTTSTNTTTQSSSLLLSSGGDKATKLVPSSPKHEEEEEEEEEHVAIPTNGEQASLIPTQTMVEWIVTSFYSGSLVKEPKRCELNVTMFVDFDHTDERIAQVLFSWDASNVMMQLEMSE